MRGTVEERFWAKVEKTDGCWNWTAAIDQKGYGRFSIGTSMKLAHRVSYEMLLGPLESSRVHLDHACRNTACVNPGHLRPVTHKQNMENRSGANANNKSGIRGVSIHKTSGLWQATVSHRGKRIHLGYFKNPTEAGAVAQAKRNELFTHNNLDRAA